MGRSTAYFPNFSSHILHPTHTFTPSDLAHHFTTLLLHRQFVQGLVLRHKSRRGKAVTARLRCILLPRARTTSKTKT